MTTSALLLPAGLVLIGLLVGFGFGVALGWLTQQGLDRVLQVDATVLRAAVARPAAATAGTSRPGMPFYRDPAGGGW